MWDGQLVRTGLELSQQSWVSQSRTLRPTFTSSSQESPDPSVTTQPVISSSFSICRHMLFIMAPWCISKGNVWQILTKVVWGVVVCWACSGMMPGGSRWPGIRHAGPHKWAVGPARQQRRPEPGHWGLGIEKPRSQRNQKSNQFQGIGIGTAKAGVQRGILAWKLRLSPAQKNWTYRKKIDSQQIWQVSLKNGGRWRRRWWRPPRHWGEVQEGDQQGDGQPEGVFDTAGVWHSENIS